MKKISILITLLQILLLSSCSSNNSATIEIDDFANENSNYAIPFTYKSDYVKNGYISHLIPQLCFDNSDNNPQVATIQFYAGISSLDLNISIKSLIFSDEKMKDILKEAQETKLKYAYSKILVDDVYISAQDAFPGTDAKYFISFEIRNIPKDYWFSTISVETVANNFTFISRKEVANVYGINSFDLPLESNKFKVLQTYETENGLECDIEVKDKKITDYSIESFTFDWYRHNPTHSWVLEKMPSMKIKSISFEDCVNLSKVTVGNGLTEIPAKGFKNCSQLEEVVISDSIINIGKEAFYGCSSLSKIVIPLSVQSIDDYAFADCVSLKSIVVPSNVKRIGKYCFSNCTNLVNVSISNGINTIDDYCFSGCISLTEITIPYTVTEVGEYLLEKCSSLTKITTSTVPELFGKMFGSTMYDKSRKVTQYVYSRQSSSIEQVISSNDFYLPEALSYFEITNFCPENFLNNVGYIDELVFGENCVFADDAFYHSGNLSTDSYSFFSFNLTSKGINKYGGKPYDKLSAPNITYSRSDSSNAIFFNTLQTDLIKKMTIKAFDNCQSMYFNPLGLGNNVEEVVFDDSFTKISGSFYLYKRLKTIHLPKNLIQIGGFRETSAIEVIEIPETLEIVDDYAFYKCTCPILIKGKLKTVGKYAFNGCSNLNSIDISNAQVGIQAFINCNLATIKVGINTQFDSTSFFGLKVEYLYYDDTFDSFVSQMFNITCSHLYLKGDVELSEILEIPYGTKEIYHGMYNYLQFVKKIIIPDTVTKIADSAFGGMSSLEEIEIPNSVVSLSTGIFANCVSLKSIKLPFLGFSPTNPFPLCRLFGTYEDNNMDKVTWLVSANKVFEYRTTIMEFGTKGDEPCYYYIPKELSSITIEKGMIADFAFINLYKIKEVNLNKVTRIGDYAFYSCFGLSKVNIPDTVTYIGTNAFAQCHKISQISIPQSVTSFGSHPFVCINQLSECIVGGDISNAEGLFEGCKKLTNVIFKNLKCNTIPKCAFNYCTSLSEISIPKEIEILEESSFANCSQLNKVISETNKLILKKSCFENTGFSSFNFSDYIIDGEQIITGSQSVTTVNVKDVESLSKKAFANCINLVNVISSEFLKTIGEESFAGCSSLESIDLSSVEILENSCFSYCESLKSLKLGTTLTNIGNYVFQNCSSLEHITLPKSLIKIGDYVFSNSSVKTIFYNGTKEEWNNISKSSTWNSDAAISRIVCENGDIVL